jgi:outer membrane protein assembly factor BamE (lipoprotein component of BamABCDE complex)
MNVKPRNPLTAVALAIAAAIAHQAHAQFDPALMQGKMDPEAMKQAQKMMQQIQGSMQSGVPKEQAVNQAVDQMVKGIQSGQKEQLNSMAANLKSIKVGVDTKDDVSAKLGQPFTSMKYNEYETWSYIGGVGGSESGAAVTVQFDPSGVVTCVQAQKLGMSGSEVVYSAGKFAGLGVVSGEGEASSAKGPTLVNRGATAPANPEEGQIYFNTTEKCFYGWNGSSWVMLGTNP